MKFLFVFGLVSYVLWLGMRGLCIMVWPKALGFVAFTAGGIVFSWVFLVAAILGAVFAAWATD